MEGRGRVVVGRANGWEALGKADSAETEPRSQIFEVKVADSGITR